MVIELTLHELLCCGFESTTGVGLARDTKPDFNLFWTAAATLDYFCGAGGGGGGGDGGGGGGDVGSASGGKK
ncbi:hypothetical protein PoB_006682100 [Plakobranchus ocellatus]|uniref:Uncharacterized protein n=1 Tax=Plakobranchus ocellatus TaxID=259542 RepID=A0AAV4D845_9GAST|nr:hypothetical protein PoB_006682100 [Plakobranchus ocellatus]